MYISKAAAPNYNISCKAKGKIDTTTAGRVGEGTESQIGSG